MNNEILSFYSRDLSQVDLKAIFRNRVDFHRKSMATVYPVFETMAPPVHHNSGHGPSYPIEIQLKSQEFYIICDYCCEHEKFLVFFKKKIY